MSEAGVQTPLLGRPWVLLLLFCLPTVLATAAVAFNYGGSPGSGVAEPLAPAQQNAAAISRDVARSMVPGTQVADVGGIVASISYAGEVSQLPATATVFVFARRPGVPMPVAVEKYQPSQLPVEVVFRGTQDEAEPLQITARLSLAGGVRLEASDVEASSEPLVPGLQETHIDLRIPPL
jgi:hypothetical protein